MSALKIVLLAEGVGEVGDNSLRQPKAVIPEDECGPAHCLISRVLERERTLPRSAQRFHEPLRTTRGTVARGSNLRAAVSLRKLLNYLPEDRPDLIIVLVDADDEPHVDGVLERSIEDIPGDKVVAVAVKEFEAWLLCAHEQAPANVEGLKPGEAKERLASLLASSPDPKLARKTLAEKLDLDRLLKNSKSFGSCVKKLRK
ncbi:MAG: hypothetical protein DI536_24430 [Archangium gephyra]|uniref:DUF4276 family protein n=1 Tax=Archangium gephyra TaxID=48 RepID=A0A2W5T0R0_9BACT|nr:MAG: hypothetical protein DI536_24430 [Archangium gephyra]